MNTVNGLTSDKHELVTSIGQFNTMQSINHQKPHSAALTNKWLRRTYTTGFVFFLVKGVAWIVAAVWVIA